MNTELDILLTQARDYLDAINATVTPLSAGEQHAAHLIDRLITIAEDLQRRLNGAIEIAHRPPPPNRHLPNPPPPYYYSQKPTAFCTRCSRLLEIGETRLCTSCRRESNIVAGSGERE